MKIKMYRKMPDARWSGSLIQQNHGETDDKGFLIWDIEDKNKHTVRHIAIPNPKPFISVQLEPDGSIPDNLNIKNDSRIRVISNTNLSLDIIRKSLDIIQTNYKPDSLTFIDKSEDKNSVSSLINQFKKEDLRNIFTQEKLITEYLKDYNISDELLLRVFDINKKYNSIIETNEKVARNIDFKVLKLEWDNLFNYGQNNSLDFSKLDGIVGIFGKNYSGKSNSINCLLYTVYNSITKKSKKSVNIINLNCESGFGKVWLKIGDKTYCISRKSEKYLKRLHGSETIEAKTVVNFELIDPISGETLDSFNGIDSDETNQNIVKFFGSKDDFMLTSMSSQLGSLAYIDKGSTDRKEILARFLDLDFFAEKFNLANDEVGTIKSSLKRFENIDFGKAIAEINELFVSNERKTKTTKEKCDNIKNDIIPLEKDLIVLEERLNKFSNETIDIETIKSLILTKEQDKVKLAQEVLLSDKNIKDNEIRLENAIKFINVFDIDTINTKENDINQFEDLLNKIELEIDGKTKDLKIDLKKVELLNQVPCGPEYSHCKFIKGAYEAKDNINIINLVLERSNNDKKEIENKLLDINPDKVRDQIKKNSTLLEKKNNFSRELENYKFQSETKKSNLIVLEHELDKLKIQEQNYIKNKEYFDELDNLSSLKGERYKKIRDLKNQLEICDKEILEYYKIHGALNQKILTLQKDKEEFETLRKNYEAYDLFLKCMHSNGISYDIIKKSLPTINNEIAKNLANVVDFEVYFQNEENRLELYIKKQNDKDPLPLEMGSVAQNMLAAMAIRLAFIHVSSLPRSDIFILDEPATALDAGSMNGFLRILDIIKSHFKCVLLISHLEQIKDAADIVFNVEEKQGFATLTQ